MTRFIKQFVLYLATAVIMLMTLAAIAAWHLFKVGYQLTRFFKTGQPNAPVPCRKSAEPAEDVSRSAQKENFESPVVSASEKV